MKDSGIEWIGEIPEDWEISKFKNSSNLYVGDSIKDNEKDNYLDKDDAKAYVATKDLIIDENMVDFSNTLYVKNDNLKFKTAPKGSSLICIEGGSAGRKKAFLDRDVCFVNKLCCINPLNSMDKKYMFYLISNQAFEQEFDKYIQGLIGGVSINKLSNFNIPLPTLREQHKVSSFLDNEVNKINISIGYIYEQIENLKNYKKSVITEAVTKGLNKNVEMKDSGIEWIGEIPKHWKVIRIKNAAILKARIGWQGLKSDEFLDDSNLPYLVTGTDFKDGLVDWDSCVRISEKRFEMDKNIQINENDLLITKDGTIGKLAIARNCPYKASLNSGVFVIRNKGTYEYNDKYMYYLLKSEQFYLWFELNDAGNSTIRHLYQRDFYNFSFTYPETKEQNQIVDYLDKKTKLIDDSIAIKQKQLETLEEYKKSLIYEYVTGKKEVKDGEET